MCLLCFYMCFRSAIVLVYRPSVLYISVWLHHNFYNASWFFQHFFFLSPARFCALWRLTIAAAANGHTECGYVQHVCGVASLQPSTRKKNAPEIHSKMSSTRTRNKEEWEEKKCNSTDYHCSRRPNGNWIRNEVVIFQLCWFCFFGSGKSFSQAKVLSAFDCIAVENINWDNFAIALKANIKLHRISYRIICVLRATKRERDSDRVFLLLQPLKRLLYTFLAN